MGLVWMLLLSCTQDKPKIDYTESVDTSSVVDDRMKDTTKIVVSELPIKFDSTDYLLFAIGMIDLQERNGYSKIGLGSYGSSSNGSYSYFNNDQLFGDFINIVFQDKDGNERKLTDRKLSINSVSFLRDIFERTKNGYLLYRVSDRDSNRDGKLNDSDLEALYISKIDGSDFKKITRELHELYDWNLIKPDNKIFFRTLEDSNKDGDLNNKDTFHYYYIEFSGNQYIVKEHDPLKVLK